MTTSLDKRNKTMSATKDGREQTNIARDHIGRGGRELYADSFRNNALQPLKEERKNITELIIQTQEIPFTRITPEKSEKLLADLWARRRDIECRIANL